jgi:hypothetical protein
MKDGIPNLDPIVLKFLAQNTITCLTGLGILKALAKLTPWAHDDEIVQIFTGVFDRGGKPGPRPSVPRV